MGSIKLNSNIGLIADAFRNIDDEIDQVIESVMVDTGRKIVRKAQEESPVVTGFFRDSWNFDLDAVNDDEIDILINNMADYASFVHEKGDSSKTPIASQIVEEAATEESENVQKLLTARILALLDSAG